jgi:hypothetical protein
VLGLALVPPLAMALGLPGAFIATVSNILHTMHQLTLHGM